MTTINCGAAEDSFLVDIHLSTKPGQRQFLRGRGCDVRIAFIILCATRFSPPMVKP